MVLGDFLLTHLLNGIKEFVDMIETGQGILIELLVSSDGESIDVPDINFVPAKTVEDLEKKHGRF